MLAINSMGKHSCRWGFIMLHHASSWWNLNIHHQFNWSQLDAMVQIISLLINSIRSDPFVYISIDIIIGLPSRSINGQRHPSNIIWNQVSKVLIPCMSRLSILMLPSPLTLPLKRVTSPQSTLSSPLTNSRTRTMNLWYACVALLPFHSSTSIIPSFITTILHSNLNPIRNWVLTDASSPTILSYPDLPSHLILQRVSSTLPLP